MKNLRTLRIARWALLIPALFAPSAYAERKQINYSASSAANSWKIENYLGDSIVVWGTPSACSGGALVFPENASKADRNRFYATVMAAKASNLTMFVYYDETPASCLIVSFGLY